MASSKSHEKTLQLAITSIKQFLKKQKKQSGWHSRLNKINNVIAFSKWTKGKGEKKWPFSIIIMCIINMASSLLKVIYLADLFLWGWDNKPRLSPLDVGLIL